MRKDWVKRATSPSPNPSGMGLVVVLMRWWQIQVYRGPNLSCVLGGFRTLLEQCDGQPDMCGAYSVHSGSPNLTSSHLYWYDRVTSSSKTPLLASLCKQTAGKKFWVLLPQKDLQGRSTMETTASLITSRGNNLSKSSKETQITLRTQT